ncbi:putative DCC family thiol-disulfide oxidoreductase YuxK [Hymenobacter luteus]|uniref:DCC family thiol-disulfide oxidoreductase YuxK n=2 Tax=Hymenobacter TaxID=89966 RepID=A0ABR6JUL6_9BACT|nr:MULTISPECIES: thiol-disulfide oxidoreductase DCC family protein [Hymenobacter]MBB4600504.1 putative DCC family thiol-disulfide oxidoreductase YuxK [Hymenobacter latericoloratus]MBB6057186.1 putative DCC family thiol-disulfide oxidoreductase YuxK [Hymenobacter luteus]
MPSASTATILFDGVCNLCNGFVQFVIEHDAAGRFRFASLQSGVGQELLRSHGLLPQQEPDSVVLLEGGRAYTHSAAALGVLRGLGGLWGVVGTVGQLFPRFLRDAVYRLVARNRYRWFGRQEACWLPTPELKARFL